jgi:hypothetical protein
MTKTIENLFFYLVYLFDLLVIVQALFLVRKKADRRVLFALITCCFVNSTCNYIQEFTNGLGDYLIGLGFTLIEYSVFTYIFYIISRTRLFRKSLILLSCVFLLVIILNYSTSHIAKIDSVPIGVETIIIFAYAFYYLYEQMNILDDSFIYNRYHFWLVIGMMIYLGGSFFIYIFANGVHNDILDKYWFLTYAFYITKDIFFIIGLLIYAKLKTKSRVQNLHPYLNLTHK